MSSCDILNLRNSQVALAIEAVEGTPETLAAGDAGMTVYEPLFSPDIARFTRAPARASLSRLRASMGRELGSISFAVDLMGSGDVTVAPSWSPALQCCGFAEYSISSITIGTVTNGPFLPGEVVTFQGGGEGIVAGEVGSSPLYFVLTNSTSPLSGETVTGQTSTATATTTGAELASKGFLWLPDSTCPPSATVGLYQDGVRHLISGARGNVAFNGNSADGSPARMAFTFQGVYQGTTDTALLSGVTYEDVVPPTFMGVGLAVHGFSLDEKGLFTNWSLDMANTFAPRLSANATKGALSVVIGDRAPAGSIDPEMVLVADHDWFGRFASGSVGRMSLTVGSSAGNRIQVAMPNVQYSAISPSDRNGILVAGVSYEAVSASVNTGDDELSIRLT